MNITRVSLETSMSEALKTGIILNRQGEILAEIQARLVTFETRQRQLLETISASSSVAPTGRQPPRERLIAILTTRTRGKVRGPTQTEGKLPLVFSVLYIQQIVMRPPFLPGGNKPHSL